MSSPLKALILLAVAGRVSSFKCFTCASKNVESWTTGQDVFVSVPPFTDDCKEDLVNGSTAVLETECESQCMFQEIEDDKGDGFVRGCLAKLYKKYTESPDGCHDHLKFLDKESETCFCKRDHCNQNHGNHLKTSVPFLFFAMFLRMILL